MFEPEFVVRNIRPKNIFGLNIRVQKYLDQQMFNDIFIQNIRSKKLGQNMLGRKKLFLTIFGPKISGPNKCWVQKNVVFKNILGPKILGSKDFRSKKSCPKNISQKNFGSKRFLVQKFLLI